MGKLNIAHHKSYHPYRADNIARVRRDEEEAQLKEERDEGRMMMADAEARLDVLRQRIGSSSASKKRAAKKNDDEDLKRIASGTPGLVQDESSSESLPLTTPTGHINLFPSLEASLSAHQLQQLEKKARDLAAQKEEEKGAPLAPSKNDLTPWYADRELKGGKERELEKDDRANDRRQRKQLQSKTSSDPLREMRAHLAKRAEVLSTSVPSSSAVFKAPYPPPTSSTPSSADVSRSARLSRESSERDRAQALRARKKREAELAARGSETPSTSIGGETPAGYRDVFNAQELQQAREARERGGTRVRWNDRRWDDEDDRDRSSGSRSRGHSASRERSSGRIVEEWRDGGRERDRSSSRDRGRDGERHHRR